MDHRPAIEPAPDEATDALLTEASSAQREIWLAQRLRPGSAFSLGVCAHAQGPVDRDRLARAIAIVVAETPALRTRFVARGDRLYRCAEDPQRRWFTFLDLRDAASPDAQAEAWMREDYSRPLMADEPGLCAFALIRTGASRFYWYQRYHHIVIDGRSAALVVKRIAQAYAAIGADAERAPLSFVDERGAPAGGASDGAAWQAGSDWAFWNDYLGGDFRAAWLARDLGRPASGRRPHHTFQTRFAQTARVARAAAAIDVAPAHLWIAAIAMHFHALVGRRDLQFSFPVANCAKRELEVPGATSNVVPLRLRVDPVRRLDEMARDVKREVSRLLRRQRYRGEEIRRRAGIRQDGWFGPSINLMTFDCGAPFPGCEFTWDSPSIGPVDDFSLAVIDYGDGATQQIIARDVATVHGIDELRAHTEQVVRIVDRFAEHADETVASVQASLADGRARALGASFYARRRRVVAAGCLRWTSSAQSLAAVVQTLRVGSYDNPLPLPKVWFGDGALCVGDLRAAGARSGAPAGTVISLAPDHWRIATATDDVIVSGFTDMSGGALAGDVAARQAGIGEGDRLPVMDDSLVQAITEEAAAAEAHEGFWADRLSRGQSLRLPYERSGAAQEPGSPSWRSRPCDGLAIPPASTNEELPDTASVIAAWVTYLARITGERALQLAWRAAPREREAGPKTAWLFASDVPLEVDVDLGESVATLVAKVRGELDLLARHGACPRDVVSRYARARASGHLRLQRPWRVGLAVIGPDAPDAVTPRGGGALLTLELRPHDGTCRWIYDAVRIDAAQLDRMTGHLRLLVQAIVDPRAADRPLATLEILPPSERALLLDTFNDTDTPRAGEQRIHVLFEQQARRTPSAPAVECGGDALTYAELNIEANRLAHQLIALGVRPDDRVAICAARSTHLVLGLMAILKSGGAYVPLDPAYQSTRLLDILADADPAIVLCDAAGRALLGPDALAHRIALDLGTRGASAPWARQPSTDPDAHASGVTDRHLAYVIYTSGSTGTPKGVMVEHRSVANFHAAMNASIYREGRSPSPLRIGWNASFSFDMSLKGFLQLLSGHCLVVIPQDVRVSGAALLAFLQRERVDGFDTTPSQLQLLIAAGLLDAARETPLIVLVGGEPVDPAMWAQLQRCASLEVHNMYGPTECTVDATIGRLAPDDGGPHIGRPIANMRIYLLDASRQPVPLGAAGEIYIGGVGVARGYWRQPALTAERFLRDPFSAAPDARMYKTGDLARHRPEGRLEYIGRNDHQVKIRGFRIELGEIEARLAQHPDLSAAVVIARDDGGQETRLVAYVVPAASDAATSARWAESDLAVGLRAYLSERLPEYMIPAAFVRMPKLPLTPNGKLDRAALPAPDGDAFARRAYEPPRGPIEETLARVWQEQLGLPRVGRRDHFFELGGHSVLAVRVLARVRETLGVELPMATLFARPMLAQLAEAAAMESGREAPASDPPIAPVPREPWMPPSFAQQRLWFLAQLNALGAAYHIPAALRLHGRLDRGALRRGLDAIVARHEALRSRFAAIDGEPRVELLPPDVGLPAIEHDLRGVPDAVEQLDRISAEEAKAPFDLARGPLVRARLVRLADDEHVLLVTQHHIVSDGWSLRIFAEELGALYRAFTEGRPDPLPPLPIQYPDYAAWQREWLSGARWQRQVAYWRETLAGAPVLLELPTDRPRPSVQRFDGAVVPITIEPELRQALEALCARHGTTLFMTLLAAWAAVLARLSGQEDVVIGVPASNRPRTETEGLIGFFVNTLALRLDLAGDPRIGELLSRVRTAAVGAQDHQDLPFEQVVEIAQPPRRLNHAPLCQVMFSWQNDQRLLPRLPGIEAEWSGTLFDVAKFDLQLDLIEQGATLSGAFIYSTALFDEATIVRHRGYLLAMLQAMVRDPEQVAARVELAGADERARLAAWNATSAPYAADRCLHQLFEAQVERTPSAIAVLSETRTLSYAQLNADANQLAHHLIAHGVRPDGRVAICMDRGAGMVVGLLAILKAGGAYVPLDPAYPPARLAEILTDAAPAIVITDTAGRAALGAALPADGIVLDLDPPRPDAAEPRPWAAQPATNPDAAALGLTSRHLAYIIYTSGSTGRPKGVMNEHHALVNRLTWMQRAYRLDRSDIVLQKTSFGFDVSVWEFFWTLIEGATLATPPPDAHKDASRLVHWIRRWNVTTIHFVPSMLGTFLATRDVERCVSLRRLICSGEALPAAHAQAVLRQLPDVQLHNLYGPTEAAIDVTAWSCPRDFDAAVVPIGRPIANTQIHLLDARLQPVPLGAIGELYIGGAGVARGYWNRPALTAERFLRDPWSTAPDARLYKTGDLARQWPDGLIEFLGRNDHQVKIRGFRIELGEIEARLAEHPSVRAAVVIAREDTPGDKRLVAYIVLSADETEPGLPQSNASTALSTMDDWTGEIRAWLAGQLPDYMVPAAFVRLAALPLTPNGKLDRSALRPPDGDAFARRAYEPPQGEVEEALARLWQELLGVARVGRHDHFFELGGHSLLAVRFLGQVQARLHARLELSTLFRYPQLALLAKQVLLASIEQEFDPDELRHLLAERRASASGRAH